MRQVRYSVAASLDGYIADADGKFDWIPEDATVDFGAIFARVDTVLLGRRSFEVVQSGGGPPWGAHMRGDGFSHTLGPAAYPGVAVGGAKGGGVVRALRAEPGSGGMWVFRGGPVF